MNAASQNQNATLKSASKVEFNHFGAKLGHDDDEMIMIWLQTETNKFVSMKNNNKKEGWLDKSFLKLFWIFLGREPLNFSYDETF